MKQITIDRFDGIYAICEDKDKAFFAIETSELPQGAKAGDVLKITDDGALSIDVEETERRRVKNDFCIHTLRANLTTVAPVPSNLQRTCFERRESTSWHGCYKAQPRPSPQ